MIARNLTKNLQKLATYFPVVSITGPRQSGKSTIIQLAFPKHDYLNLENETLYHKAKNDPIGFIFNTKNNTIIDEAQLIPELFSAIQLFVDKYDTSGRFILSGSQNFLLSKKINQSLAGRIGLAKLLPLSYSEIKTTKIDVSINELILNGGYPRLHKSNIPPKLFYANYLNTYIKRDVEGFLSVNNSIDFSKLIQLLASNTGNLLNYSRLANDLAIDIKTVRNWISILVSSYVIYLLPSYSANTRKQVIKTPKIYFLDTGLLCYLLKLHTVEELINSENFGSIFENYIIIEQIKKYYNELSDPEIYYYRDKSKMEIDMVDLSEVGAFKACEIKSGMTFKPEYIRNISRSNQLLNKKNIDKYLIYKGNYTFSYEDTQIIDVEDWLSKITN